MDLGDGKGPLPELCRGGGRPCPSPTRKSRESLCSLKSSSFLVGSERKPWSLRTLFSLVELRLDLAVFEDAGLVDQLGQAGDLRSRKGGRVHGSDHVFELVMSVLLLRHRQFVEVIGKPLLDLLLPVGVGSARIFFRRSRHPFEACRRTA